MSDTEVLQRLLEKLEDFSEIQIQITRMATQMEQVVKTQEDLTLAVKGNGKPGLADRVKDLESNLANHVQYCPVKPVVDQLMKEREGREAAKSDERKEAVRVKYSLVASVTMLILSTIANLALALLRAKP